MMSYKKILITGASGFIGTRLCEKFKLQYLLPHRALVRTFARAARIGRLGTEMLAGDLTDLGSLEAALTGCDAVVHLAYSNDRRVEQNVVAACQRARVKRLIHMSSMAVHGPNPGPECAREETATIGHYGEAYSDSKARAEKVVQRAIGRGLPGVILRPTIVYGPYGPFVIRVIRDARSGEISLIDEGRGICNAVHVDDVCDAVYAALQSDRALGMALFVNADRAVSWKEFNLTFANMVTPPPVVSNFSAKEVRAHWESMKPWLRSNVAALRRLVASPEFREQLKTVPALHSAVSWGRSVLRKMVPAERVAALKSPVVGNTGPGQRPEWPDPGRIVREDFHVDFSNELAKSVLAWKPGYDFAAGAAMTRTWLEFAGMLRPVV